MTLNYCLGFKRVGKATAGGGEVVVEEGGYKEAVDLVFGLRGVGEGFWS